MSFDQVLGIVHLASAGPAWRYNLDMLRIGLRAAEDVATESGVERNRLQERFKALLTGQIALPQKEEIEVLKSKALQLFSFEGNQIRVVVKDNQPWLVVKDVCGALNIVNYRDALSSLDDDEKGVGKIDTLGGQQSMAIVNESGTYTLIMRSNKPEARKFRKWLTSEVLPAIRRTGEYATPAAQLRKADKSDELALRRIEIMEKNANYRMAMAILKGMDKFQESMTPESKTVYMVAYGQLVTQQDMKHMLPAATEKWYTATELSEEFGVSANMIGRIANQNGLKAPAGQSNQYGTWIRDKSPHSTKEVMNWVYFEAARKWFEGYFREKKTA